MKAKHKILRILKALNPFSLEDSADFLWRSIFGYFFLLIFVGTIIFAICNIPIIYNFNNNIQNSISKFSTLKFNASAELDTPILYPKHDPFLIIDMTNSTKYYSGIEPKAIFGKEEVNFRFMGNNIISYDMFQDVVKNKDKISAFLFGLLLLALPGLLILTYIIFWIYYFIMSLLLAIIGFLFTRIIRFDIKFSSSLKIALYSSTIIVILNAFFWAFHIQTYYLQYALWIIVFAIGISRAGSKIEKHKVYGKGKRGKKASDEDEWIMIKGE